MDTIFALATTRGKSGVAIIRVSGPAAFEACSALAGRVPSRRLATLCLLRDADGAPIDEALVLTFDAGASFTGETVVEFQTHGSRAVVMAVLAHLAVLPNLRPAGAGEFTRRALENGRLDLTQVEGLADLIDAETEAQRKLALRSFGGELSRKTDRWRGWIVRALALIEATIDFADEDVPVDVAPEVRDLANRLSEEIAAEVAGSRAAERLRDGFEVAIVGKPNVGKSTLLNALAGRPAALTSDIPGTTRDVIEVRMDIDGLPVTLLDTAGMRQTEDVVEAAGVQLAEDRARAADLRLFLVEADELPPLYQEGDIVARAKADLHPDVSHAISGRTGAGLDWVLAEIGARLAGRVAAASTAGHVRQRVALEHALVGIRQALAGLDAGAGTELVSEDLRRASHALQVLLGKVDVEEVLGEIFSSFCIGK